MRYQKRRIPRSHKTKLNRDFSKVKTIVFFFVLFTIAFLGLLLPLRPTYSDFEKRELTKFPEFSFAALWSGEYFSQIDLWFSDTFPFRENLISLNSQVESLYGVQPVQLSGSLEEGDEIPSSPTRPSVAALLSPSQLTEETSTSAMQSSASLGESTAAESSVPEGESTSVGSAASSDESFAQDTTASSDESSAQDTTASSDESFVPDTASPSESSEELPTERDISNEVTQNLGAVLIVGDAGYEYYGFSQSTATKYINLINYTAQALSGRATVYDMIVPTSMDIILPESFRAGLNTSSQRDAINYFYGSFSDLVHAIPVYDTLIAHNDEYIYFRTDHHWTALGAYYAYMPFIEATGRQALPLSAFETRSFNGFLGAFYSDTGKNPALTQNPDTVIAYVPPVDADLSFIDRYGSLVNWPIISDVSSWSAGSKYSTFIGGDNPYSVILNNELTDGSCCLVIKESFGNAFIPFLVPHYQTIHVIDYRYWNGNIPDFVIQNGIQDVLFINNISATRNASIIGRMARLVGLS